MSACGKTGARQISLLHRARRAVQKLGIDVRRFPRYEPEFRRVQLLRHHGIDHVFDVGASDGSYVSELRRFGYLGRVLSFEPLEQPFRELARRAAYDPLWDCLPYALGPEPATVYMNVAGNAAASSSILSMLPLHESVAPASAYVTTERVEQRPLDEFWGRYTGPAARIFVKLDVQGYEADVLDGAAELMRHCRGIQVELSLVPLYQGAPLYLDMLKRLSASGFILASMESGFTDPGTGQTLQVDAVFFRGDR
jgi:FkbM family methyltransferase